MALYERVKSWNYNEDLYYQDLNAEFDALAASCNTIATAQIGSGAVQETHIQNLAVGTTEIGSAAVALSQLAPQSVSKVVSAGSPKGVLYPGIVPARPNNYTTLATINMGVNPGSVLLIAYAAVEGGLDPVDHWAGYHFRIMADLYGYGLFNTKVAENCDPGKKQPTSPDRTYSAGMAISTSDWIHDSPELVPIMVVHAPPEDWGTDIRYRLQCQRKDDVLHVCYVYEYMLVGIGLKR